MPPALLAHVLSSALTHGGLLEPLASPALGLPRPTFPAMRLATRLSSLQCTLQPSSHLFTIKSPSRSLLSAAPTLLTVRPAAHATARVSCPCSSTPLSSDQAPYLTPP
ncbi:hypothetical protein C8J57DRAFT_1312979 [Mycena rebaudengoi]|nr:hypothetical protein C8J57DRAFT_1312979 [Mycena rebaudengoi]